MLEHILVYGILVKMNKISVVYDLVKNHFSAYGKSSHDFEHTKRVYRLALFIGKKESADIEILSYASLLHDIGRHMQDETKGRICHAEYGCELAGDILKNLEIEEEKIRKILNCILRHRSKGHLIPQTIEEKILFDSDKIDSIGATGIGRAFMFASEVGADLHNPYVSIDESCAYSKDDTAYREYLLTLSKVKDRVFTKTAKKIAKKRSRFMDEFFKQLNKEFDLKL